MEHLRKFVLPAGLAAIAGILNWSSIRSKTSPVSFVRVAERVEQGVTFTHRNIGRVEIHGAVGSLAKTAVLWKDRAVLLNRPCPRYLEAGDLVLWRDATITSDQLPAEDGEVPIHVSLSGTTSIPDFIRIGQQVAFYVGESLNRNSPTNAAHVPDGSSETARADRYDYIGPYRVLAVGHRNLQDDSRTKSSQGGQILTLAAPFDAQTQRLTDQTYRLLEATKGGREQVLTMVLHSNRNHVRSEGA